MRPGIALTCLVGAVVVAALVAGCLGEPDGSLPPPVEFTPEVTGGVGNDLVLRYYPNTTEPASYSVTFEIKVAGEVTDAVAGRAFSGISAADPIELPPVPAEPGDEVSVQVTIFDEYGRTVHTETTSFLAGDGLQVTT